MKRTLFAVLAFLCASLSPETFAQTENLDLEVAYRIKRESATHSQVEPILYSLTDAVGHRLTGSDGMEAGYLAAQEQMQNIGLQNIRKDFARTWHRGGWDMEKVYCAMQAPYYMHIYALPVGWSGGTGGLKSGDVVLVDAKTREELNTYKGKVKNKIVLIASVNKYQIKEPLHPVRMTDETLEKLAHDYPLEEFGHIRKDRSRRAFAYDDIVDFLQKEGAIAVINNSGDFNVPRTTHYDYRQGTPEPLCQLNITSEVHQVMQRLIKSGKEVKMEVEVAVRYTPDRDIYNMFGDISGADPALQDQIVLMGAHLDSHHGGSGSTDNAANCAVMLEAARILNALNIQPRRTIRVALWGGEEMGLHGSGGYIEQYITDPATGQPKADHAKISAYFNSDYGPGRYRGIYAQDNLMMVPVFEQWAQPYRDMGFTTVTSRSIGSTDHIPFDDAGIPAFQFIHDYVEWYKAAHAAMDFPDHIIMDDLKHNAIILAWFVYNAAMRDEMIPRKPMN